MLNALRARIRARVTDDWRRSWKWASVRISALGTAAFGTLAMFPDLAREGWAVLPADLRARLPDNLGMVVAALLFAGVLFGRMHKKPEKSPDKTDD